ncbi:MAG: LapA family protein [Gammaproteobacteria bacterium]|nr:LapA family protein [Gammaproteobacteria bacterium]
MIQRRTPIEKIKLISLGVIAFLLAIFLIQNLKIVSINFLFWGMDLPRIVLVFIIFTTGAIFGVIIFSMYQKKRIKKTR